MLCLLRGVKHRTTRLANGQRCSGRRRSLAIAETHGPDSIYPEVREQLSEKELVDLTYAIAAINSWNRLAISFRMEAGSTKCRNRTRWAPRKRCGDVQ